MDVNELEYRMKALLVGAEIANFEYWSEFIVRIQRDNSNRSAEIERLWEGTRIPPLFWLRLRSSWRVGDVEEWAARVSSFPIKRGSGYPIEGPLQASVLMQLLGEQIVDLSLATNGDLQIDLSHSWSLLISGRSKWDESWMLELPSDDSDRTEWWVKCDSKGELDAQFGPPRIAARSPLA